MNNFHTHTTRCGHAFGKDRDYIEKAIKAGIKVLGFSDHAPMLFPDEKYYSNFRIKLKDVDDYFNSISLLKEEYKNDIEIHIGFEIEYLPKLFNITTSWLEEKGAEYFILGQHFTDNEYESYAHYCNSPTDSVELFNKYISQALAGLSSGKILYIAHPDLFKYTGPDNIYNEKMTYFCNEIKKLDKPLEFNLLGFSQHRNYPDKRFWNIASDIGNKVTIGFDAHSPEVFQNRLLYDEAREYLDKLNITPVEIELK